MSPRSLSTTAFFVVSLTLVGCNRPTPPSVGSAAPKMVETGPPVSEAEAGEYGRQVVAAFQAEDADGMAKLLRIEDVCERSVSDFNLTPGERKAVTDGFRKSGGARVCRGWMDQLDGAEVTLLRTRVRDGRRTVVVRFIGEQIGLNYFEFTLARGADGRVVTEDVYLVVAGETLTQLIRRMLLATLPAKKGGGGQTQLYVDNMPAIQRLQACIRTGDHAEARRIYRGLPQPLRDEKFVMLVALRAHDDDASYLAELDRYRKRFPNDPSVDLVSVDYHILKKDGKALRECLWRVDDAVGGDPALRVVDANFHLAQGDHAEARRLATEAIKLESSLLGAYWVLADVALAKNDHAETARILKAVVVQCHFQLDVEGLKTTAAYERFVTSKEYTALGEWMEKRAK